MPRLLIVAPETMGRRLAAEMGRYSFTCTIIRPADDVRSLGADAALVASEDAAFDLCRRLKTERRLPVVALVSKADLSDKLAALECDDFVVEPYDAVELSARLGRILEARGVAETKKVSAEGLVIDAAEAAVYLNGQPVELTFREYELLRYLAEHPGRVFSRDALLNAVWGYDYFGGDRTVDVHIRRLRSKIEDPEHSYIDTVRNMGYRFKKPGT